MSWTAERIELLKSLWTEGVSVELIASRLGGVSRNAVIGKAHRLNLPVHAKYNKGGAHTHKPRKRKRPMNRVKTIPRPIVEPSQDRNTWVPFMESDSLTCRSIMGRGSDGLVLFCPNSKTPEESYCLYHAKIYYNPSQRSS